MKHAREEGYTLGYDQYWCGYLMTKDFASLPQLRCCIYISLWDCMKGNIGEGLRGERTGLSIVKSRTCSAKIINRLIKLKHCKVLSQRVLRPSLSAVPIPLPAWLDGSNHSKWLDEIKLHFKLQLLLSWMRISMMKPWAPWIWAFIENADRRGITSVWSEEWELTLTYVDCLE